MIKLIQKDSYFELYSDDSLMGVFATSPIVLDEKTFEPYKNIMIMSYENYWVVLGNFKIEQTEMTVPFNEAKFIMDNLSKIEHPTFQAIKRELKLNNIIETSED